MSGMEWAVAAAGLGAIVWVNWYFFFAERSSGEATASDDGVQVVRIEVRGGYTPANVRVQRGQAVRLLFRREEEAGCSEEVVIPEFGIRRYLPVQEDTPVEFVADEVGIYEFTCGMGMLRGKIQVV